LFSSNIITTHNASQCPSKKDRNDNYFDSPKTEDGCVDFLECKLTVNYIRN
jgi:hypothetical protein